jgi:prophage tail gpP-like protein
VTRLRDTVSIESQQGPGFAIVVDRATQYEITTDLTAPSAARFELGDDGTWSVIRDALAIGARFSVSVNDRPRVTGRLLTRNLATSADGGATVQLMVRTLLADAMFCAVDAKIGVKNTNLEAIILAAFSRMGLGKADFILRANLARDVITGRSSPGTPALEIQNMTEDEARPHPPESVYAFVERHLSRFGLQMWDSADGKIVIGAPDDSQPPLYLMTSRRGQAGRSNNLLSAAKTEDYEEVPAELLVYGVGGGKDQQKARVQFLAVDDKLIAVEPILDRTAIIIDESLKTQAQARARARREMMRRRLMADSWVLETDGLTYWTGQERIPYAVDTVADVRVDVAGGAVGPYLIYQVRMAGSAERGHTTSLTCCGKGIWRLS